MEVYSFAHKTLYKLYIYVMENSIKKGEFKYNKIWKKTVRLKHFYIYIPFYTHSTTLLSSLRAKCIPLHFRKNI